MLHIPTKREFGKTWKSKLLHVKNGTFQYSRRFSMKLISAEKGLYDTIDGAVNYILSSPLSFLTLLN
jgi:hypothetical protein